MDRGYYLAVRAGQQCPHRHYELGAALARCMGTALYAITDKRTGALQVRPGDYMTGIGPEVDIRVATRGEAETHWQSPLHAGWIVAD